MLEKKSLKVRKWLGEAPSLYPGSKVETLLCLVHTLSPLQ